MLIDLSLICNKAIHELMQTLKADLTPRCDERIIGRIEIHRRQDLHGWIAHGFTTSLTLHKLYDKHRFIRFYRRHQPEGIMYIEIINGVVLKSQIFRASWDRVGNTICGE